MSGPTLVPQAAYTRYVCTRCGVLESPCEHFNERWALEEIRKSLRVIEGALCEIIRIFIPRSATLTLVVPNAKGDVMPATVKVGGTANSLFQEWTGPNGTGTVVPNAGTIAYTSDNPAVATVDPASGVATGVAPGTANISGVDSVNNLSASDVLTVSAAGAVSATLTLTAN